MHKKSAVRSPFHPGERAVQERSGEYEIAHRNGTLIQNFLTERTIDFIVNQPMVILSGQDVHENIWVSILTSEPGFVTACDAQHLCIHLRKTILHASDPLWQILNDPGGVGLLFIELETRRRLRVNGHAYYDNGVLRITIEQAYPNCPKYIQRRTFRHIATRSKRNHSYEQGIYLTTHIKEWIQKADTFFVGSADRHQHLDVSHRGGNPGFIEVLDDRSLKIPDYKGNSMFNTLGNFMVNPRAGLLFLDFEAGRTLQMTGEALIRWPATHESTHGACRFWEFVIHQWIQSDSLSGFTWEFLDYSPYNPT